MQIITSKDEDTDSVQGYITQKYFNALTTLFLLDIP